MTTTVIGTLLLNYDEVTGDEHVSISFDADFMEFDVYARLYYVDRAVDELLLATEPSDEDEDLEDEEDAEEDEDDEEEWDEESLA
jgi:hypothetical protein